MATDKKSSLRSLEKKNGLIEFLESKGLNWLTLRGRVLFVMESDADFSKISNQFNDQSAIKSKPDETSNKKSIAINEFNQGKQLGIVRNIIDNSNRKLFGMVITYDDSKLVADGTEEQMEMFSSELKAVGINSEKKY